MAGYWIVHGSAIKDQAAFDEYASRWGPIAKKYGARVLSGPGRHETREGEDHTRILIVEFPSYAQALTCYDDPDYQQAIPFAAKAYDRKLVIAEGT